MMENKANVVLMTYITFKNDSMLKYLNAYITLTKNQTK